MFIELRTASTGPMPDRACAPSRQFRWHGRHERKKFGYTAILRAETETIPSTIRDPLLPKPGDRRAD